MVGFYCSLGLGFNSNNISNAYRLYQSTTFIRLKITHTYILYLSLSQKSFSTEVLNLNIL